MRFSRFLLCALLITAFAPHHHGTGDFRSAGSQPCNLCVSTQNGTASMAADAPILAAPPVEHVVLQPMTLAPVRVEPVRPCAPRAPPF